MANHQHEPFDPATSDLIRSKARRLCGRSGFTQSDREDIEQELRLHLWRKAAMYDPAITSWEKFASFILDKRGVSLLRERAAEKRSRRREECSLNDPVLDCDGRIVDRHATTPEAASTWQRLHDLERDVADLRERLPTDEHRQFMDALGRGGTTNSTGTELGLSRRAAERYVAELRRIIEDAFRDYR